MKMQEHCPCVNVKCPNHGKCDNCVSRHLRIGHLNFCSFFTILPTLEEAISQSPESETAKQLASMIEKTKQTYEKLRSSNCITLEDTEKRIQMIRSYSDF